MLITANLAAEKADGEKSLSREFVQTICGFIKVVMTGGNNNPKQLSQTLQQATKLLSVPFAPSSARQVSKKCILLATKTAWTLADAYPEDFALLESCLGILRVGATMFDSFILWVDQILEDDEEFS